MQRDDVDEPVSKTRLFRLGWYPVVAMIAAVEGCWLHGRWSGEPDRSFTFVHGWGGPLFVGHPLALFWLGALGVALRKEHRPPSAGESAKAVILVALLVASAF